MSTLSLVTLTPSSSILTPALVTISIDYSSVCPHLVLVSSLCLGLALSTSTMSQLPGLARAWYDATYICGKCL